jgi:phytoene dehydrogenase-like protein
MKPVIEKLLTRYRDNGGEIRFGARVKKIVVGAESVKNIILDTGETIGAAQFFSSAGLVETAALGAETLPAVSQDADAGKLSFAELVLYLRDLPPGAINGAGAAITFFSNAAPFRFAEARDFIDADSGVICCPQNFAAPRGETDEIILRVTTRANYDLWQSAKNAGAENYAAAKKIAAEKMITLAEKFYPHLRDKIVFQDLFTPLTVQRYTGKTRGAIYGSPRKIRDGKTGAENLFLLGTDQGFLGIVGALLSGITIANAYGLTEVASRQLPVASV